jgi:hypothetical protein
VCVNIGNLTRSEKVLLVELYLERIVSERRTRQTRVLVGLANLSLLIAMLRMLLC